MCLSLIGNGAYKNQKIHVLEDSLVIGQADVWQAILILLRWLMAIVWNTFCFKALSAVGRGIILGAIC